MEENFFIYIDNVLLVIIIFLFITLGYEIKSQNFMVKYIKEITLCDGIIYPMQSYINC